MGARKHPAAIALLAGFSILTVALLELVTQVPSLSAVVAVLGYFVPFAAFIGIIYATHPSDAGFQVKDRAVVRLVLSAAIGGIYAALFALSAVPAAACVFAFASLGWLGMRWLRYFDF